MELCVEVPKQLKFPPLQVFNGNLLGFVLWFLFFFSLQTAICTLHLKITGASISIKEG